MKKLKVLSVNISYKKGVIKKPVNSIQLDENGVKGDAHSGPWNRQVSMLGFESIEGFEIQAGRKINFGEFADSIANVRWDDDFGKCHDAERVPKPRQRQLTRSKIYETSTHTDRHTKRNRLTNRCTPRQGKIAAGCNGS